MRTTATIGTDTSSHSDETGAAQQSKIGTATFGERAGQPGRAAMRPRESYSSQRCGNVAAPELRERENAARSPIPKGEKSPCTQSTPSVAVTLTNEHCQKIKPEMKANVEAAGSELVALLIVLYDRVAALVQKQDRVGTQVSEPMSEHPGVSGDRRLKQPSPSKLAVDAMAHFWDRVGKACISDGLPPPSIIKTWQAWAPALAPAVRRLTDSELSALRLAVTDDATANVLRIVAPREHHAPAQVLRHNLMLVVDGEASSRCQTTVSKVG